MGDQILSPIYVQRNGLEHYWKCQAQVVQTQHNLSSGPGSFCIYTHVLANNSTSENSFGGFYYF